MPTQAPGSERVAVVTGAGGGIGQALARAFSARGYALALLDLVPPTDLAAELGARAVALACDVTDEAACAAAISEVEERLGGIDVLVNNAGISHRSRFEETAPAVLRKVMDVNFFGAVSCTRAALPALKRRRGAVVALSSVAGFAPLVGRTGYAASKHALHGFFGSLRTELRGEVSVLLVCPSFVDTPLDQRALNGRGERVGRARPAVGRFLTPDEVAAEVLDALDRRDRMRLVSPVAHASLWVSRLAPALYDRLMLRSQRGEFG
jgi:NAD(P)-dependent dehydrogenase (short-subunit alcohol dehydrogenase family)